MMFVPYNLHVIYRLWWQELTRKRNKTMSLKLRLNLMITALLIMLMMVGTLMLIHNARGQVMAEIDSTAALATHLLDAETIYFSGVMRGSGNHKPFRLQGLEHLRHLRIEFRDVAGRLIDSNLASTAITKSEQPPLWFVRLMTAAMPKPVGIKRPLIVNETHMGELTVTPDPSYEIYEIWRDTIDLLTLVLVFFVLVNLMVYWAVSRALRPVDTILVALNELERGNLDSRLPAFHLPELSRISEKFNGMAQTLQQSIGRNHKLAQQLIHLQEEERKSLARDLHDELGQCLTAIRTDAAAILEMSKVKFPAARESAQAIADVTLHVMGMVSAMLQRLRPEVLDALGLQPALIDLISTWRQRNQLAGCVVRISNDLGLLDETTSITAYRIVQEALTNVARHAKARRLEIDVAKIGNSKGESILKIVVNDDGVGFYPEHADGFGLSGMRERVEGIGGRFLLVSSPGMGVKITVELPFKVQESV